MKTRYDPETDALYVGFSDVAIAEREEVHPGVMLDLDSRGRIVAIEVLDASERLSDNVGAGSAAGGFRRNERVGVAQPRKRVDARLLRSLTSTMPMQEEGAATLVRSMRDDDRF